MSVSLQPPLRSGGQVLVDALRVHGVDTVFCVPGESHLPIIDALHDHQDSIRLVVCRHEAAAAHMAEAYGKLTGRAGVCLVTRGPGITQASIGLHTAAQDSTPLLMLVGQIHSEFLGREAWQEINMAQVFQTMVKRVEQVDRVTRIPEIISRCLHAAVSGRPGPTLVSLPEDLLYAQAEVADLGAYKTVTTHAGATDMAQLVAELAKAHKPVLIVGGSGWTAQACADLQAFAERFQLPVCTGFRRQDLFDNTHALYAGALGPGVNAKLAQRLKDADLVVAIGTRLSESTSAEYTLLQAPRPRQRLVHIHPDSQELGRVYQADVLIQAGMTSCAQALAEVAATASLPVIPWTEWTQSAHADYVAALVPTTVPGDVNLGAIVAWLSQRLPANAIITNGAGNYTGWVHRFFQHKQFNTQLGPISGTMGYGVPAALAAKVVHPDRIVVCFAGDGCFLMSEQELATAKQHQLPVVFIVVNNRMYGSIRMHQEINFPGKVYGTALENPDFVLLAQAYGLQGLRVTQTDDFAAAFEAALQAPHGAVIELCTDPQAITPNTTLHALRQAHSTTSP
jgi:acetolactate synthase-1/2/3 large subunit